jgi:hypothetical protein
MINAIACVGPNRAPPSTAGNDETGLPGEAGDASVIVAPLTRPNYGAVKPRTPRHRQLMK